MDHSHHNQNGDVSPDNSNKEHTMTMGGMLMHGGIDDIIVFDTWINKSLGAFIGSCIGLMIIAAIYEGIKSLREWLIKQDIKQIEYYNGRFQIFRWRHLVQTLLHVIQVAISYFLMLVVMTFNSYICGSILLGAGLGYFFFAYKRTSTIDVNEHCH